MISVYADGSSTGRSDGPGGYGWIIVQDATGPEPREVAWSYGGSPRTTNNLMEMEGAIQGLLAVQKLKLQGLVELVSDSQYTLGIASGGYVASKNLEAAASLRALATEVGCRFRWVRGHIGEVWNEKCDQLAKQGRRENTGPELLAKVSGKRGKKSMTPGGSR